MKSGAEQLRDWVRRREFTQREAAEYFGWDEAVMSKFINGERRPGLDNAVKIEEHTGIPVRAWASIAQDIYADESPVTATVEGCK